MLSKDTVDDLDIKIEEIGGKVENHEAHVESWDDEVVEQSNSLLAQNGAETEFLQQIFRLIKEAVDLKQISSCTKRRTRRINTILKNFI